MAFLMDLFQSNPIAVTLIVLVGLLSGIMTIVGQWKPFCREVLLKRVTLPAYAYLIIIFLVALFVILCPETKGGTRKLRTIKGESFGVQRVIMDGKHFVNCKFRKTELVFRGEASSGIENCTLIQPTLTFDGPAAATGKILTSLYKVPELQPLIENTFKAIKEGRLPKAIPPSDAAND